ncbi:MAG: DEAD/DEAH box helicase, partial [Firmicutes bacterium]|nr:DEAD/DEAH box helicase [Bacillota bacterium]
SIKWQNNARKELYQSQYSPKMYLDKRQKQVLDTLEQCTPRRVFLSAPTSFGKTFLLKEIITRHSEEYKTIVIVLPTVALLQEVSSDMRELVKTKQLPYSVCNSIARDMKYQDNDNTERNIFVLTPERVLRLFALYPNIKIDFFFYDEIYKLDDDIAIVDDIGVLQSKKQFQKMSRTRIIAFRIAFYLLHKRAKEFYLAGAFINTKSLKDGFKKFIKDYGVVVCEYKFEATLKNRFVFIDKEFKKFSNIESETKETTEVKKDDKHGKLQFLKKHLNIGVDNQAIFFCLDPRYTIDYSTKYAQSLLNNESENKQSMSIRLKSFLEHIKSKFNFKIKDGESSIEHWSFSNILKQGVGIHNGAMPRYFQKEIMRLFNEKSICELFCTSTIIEGVNSNAKTIVLIQNPKGATDESKMFTLLNINGRAGRYLRHFVGNIVFLEEEQQKLYGSKLELSIDYKVFNDNLMLDEHNLQNIKCEDLGEKNKNKKMEYEKDYDKQILPDDIFECNRLVERKLQETICKEIKKSWSVFKDLPQNMHIDKFINSNIFKQMLNIYYKNNEDTKHLTDKQISRIEIILNSYAKQGYSGLLAYNLGKAKKEKVDKAYTDAFGDVKDIVEYQFPLILSLFETLINHVATMKK